MGRVIRTDRGSTHRSRILGAMAVALRAAARNPDMGQGEVRDILAFLALGLTELRNSAEETARAWEKREYWLKADRFRSEWVWVETLDTRLVDALDRRDWRAAQACGMDLASRLAERRVQARDTRSEPWRGAWDAWLQKH
jgi:hypothetical protein